MDYNFITIAALLLSVLAIGNLIWKAISFSNWKRRLDTKHTRITIENIAGEKFRINAGNLTIKSSTELAHSVHELLHH